MAKRTNKVVFKEYSPNQMLLLPPSLEEMIAADHPVRIVNRIIDSIDLDPLLKKYEGGGTSSYHPRMLLKAVVYGYLSNTYSSRKLEEAVKTNIHFMWLSGMSQPDHNTINRFRSERLKHVLKQVFKQVVLLLAEAGLVSLKEIYLDGTKIEANANRYTFVWGNSIKTSKERIGKQIEELWQYATQVAQEELKDTQPVTFDKIDAEKVRATIAQIDEALKDKPVSKKVKQKLNYAKKNWPENLEKYEQQEKILKQRGSYSKTDEDATFMRMKEDHMKNGQLKPGYNVQVSSNNQIITNYSVHQNPTDTTTLPKHLEQFSQLYEQTPHVVTADAGYGSEENYAYLEGADINAFVKYNYFHQEQTKKHQQDPFKQDNLFYNEKQDCFYCPMGQKMRKTGERKKKTSTGYEQITSLYEAQNCTGCPLKSLCHKRDGNRIIEANHRLRKYKQQAKERLLSPEGIAYRKKRSADIEPVFANIKHNKGFKRFMLRGLEKVSIETGLLAIAHNLSKMAA
jgi:transposase